MTIKPDSWESLRKLTHARIALGRSGNSVPTRELLDFRMAHSRARDSVWREVDFAPLGAVLTSSGFSSIQVQSKCSGKQNFLLNPDLGRTLSDESQARLDAHLGQGPVPDCVLIVADGLSANAVHANASAFIEGFFQSMKGVQLGIGPVVLARYARVALGDAIGFGLKAKSVIMLIGERPGLASSDSLSVYFTFDPKPGRTDADRNCISNIHESGLQPKAAGNMAAFLVRTAIQRQLSGVDLKLEYDAPKAIPSKS